jgi:hypothetical protein
MLNILMIIMLAVSTACSFKSNESEQTKARSIDELRADDLKKLDSDGDQISDFDELQRGLDPNVANIPTLDVNFLQDYNITVEFNDESQFVIDTKIARDDPDFKYRVGALFLRENSLNNAAEFGRFSGFSWGEIKQQDFSWVKYPEIDEEYYFNKRQEYSKVDSTQIKNTTITLENSIKLNETSLYSTIDQVELNFYYYSFTKEAYVQVHTEKLDRTFQSGVRENFEIIITNPPKELLENSFLRHGEFIISEVKDFYIPQLKMKYSQLLGAVKAKTIPVYRTTPLKSELNFVAVKPEGEKFVTILSKLYPEKFELNENKLMRVEQFSNGLAAFTYLHEVQNDDKSGNWFVMTNKLKEHYLNHNFTNSDSITLSFITGRELAGRAKEQVYSYRRDLASTIDGKIYPLGTITHNSELSVNLYLSKLEGVRLIATPDRYIHSPTCGSQNCTGTPWWVQADFQINEFEKLDTVWHESDLATLLASIEIHINNTTLELDKLIEANLARVKLKFSESGQQYLHLTLKGFDRIEAMNTVKENVAHIKLKPIIKGEIGRGIQINTILAHNTDPLYQLFNISALTAMQRNLPIAVTSLRFSEWQGYVNWNHPPQNGFTQKKGELTTYWEGAIYDVASSITNNYN